MILDAELQLSSDQAIAGGTDADMEDYLDFEQADPGLREGNFGLCLIVKASATGTTGFIMSIVHKASGQPTNADSDLCSVTIPKANLVKGMRVILPCPKGIKPLRYVSGYMNAITGDEAITFDAYIVPLPAIQS